MIETVHSPLNDTTFVVHCRVNMKPFNRTQPSNLQLCSSLLINHNSCFGVRGAPKNAFPRVPVFLDRSLARCIKVNKYLLIGMLTQLFKESRFNRVHLQGPTLSMGRTWCKKYLGVPLLSIRRICLRITINTLKLKTVYDSNSMFWDFRLCPRILVY